MAIDFDINDDNSYNSENILIEEMKANMDPEVIKRLLKSKSDVDPNSFI